MNSNPRIVRLRSCITSLLVILGLMATCTQAQILPKDRARTQDEPAAAPISPDDASKVVALDGGLPRRVRVGLGVVSTSDGIRVEVVQPRSAAEAAGLVVGDVIRRLDDVSLYSAATLLDRIHRLKPGDTLSLVVERDGEEVPIAIVADEAIREGDLDSRVEYNAFEGSLGRLRSVWTFPNRGVTERRPAVLVIRGVGVSAADAPGNNTFRELSFQLARNGVVAVRYDPAGIGDSEGPANETIDFEGEVADARAALEHVRAHPRVDPDRVVIVAQGTGAGIAAAIASRDERLAGLVVLGAIARPLLEYLLDSRRQQLTLAGIAPAEANAILRDHIQVFADLLLRDASVSADTLGIVAADGTVLGKTPTYWRQYDRVNFARIFSNMRIPVLNGLGEYDFVTTIGEHRMIADALKASGQTDQVITVFDAVDHDLRSYSSRDEAFERFGSTDAAVDTRAVSRIADWIVANVASSGS